VSHYQTSLVLQANPAAVYTALTTPEGLRGWWTHDCDVATEVGSTGQTFAPGQRARGPITHPGYEHVYFDVVIERIEPQDLLSYRWHPNPVDPAVDYTKEQPTLVTFALKDAPGKRTLLTVVESGFDNVPPHRRLEAFRMNSRGWEGQMDNIVRHVSA
jgi:uncharacterized protein YndB with AHSA1/START domain